ncbi:MAG: hypothetical protein IKW87_12805 [Ruminococcus sp.]|nr:hypothetical protein [Ruminococcus sp.]
MKLNIRHSLRRTVAFVCALTLLASAAFVSAFAAEKNENSTAVGTVAKHVDDYTKLFPGITDTKLKLSDPVFTEKDWYEYIEYEFYTEVKDGDMTYRIYQPTDYSAASIMAITDYNPKEALSGTNGITMNLGELQGILDIAAQGGNISKEYAGLNLATGIAAQMNGINDVMDNSRYYSSSSFLGIPGDQKYTGVSNDGFFNASSLSIDITESESVSACKTIALSSDYSISESMVSAKDVSTSKEVSEARSNTHEESDSSEHSQSVGQSISDSVSSSNEISSAISSALETSMSETFSTSVGASVETEASVEEFGVKAGVKAGVSTEMSEAYSLGVKSSQSYETGISSSIGNEHSVSQNVENTNSTGHSSSDSSSIEHSLTNGSSNTISNSHANDVALNIGYGVDYQYGNEHSLSIGVTREFTARDDKEVKNVGWKLCEYVVKIPYYIEAVKTESTGEEKVLYGQYVNYNLLNGVSRVFANGYIEHWYTGELVTYADFFDGFITATELVDKAKEQQTAKVPKEGE